MARTKIRGDGGRGGWTGWINRTLLPWIGPPPLGPYTVVPDADVLAAKARAACPICGALMSLHEIDRSGERTQVHHPTAEQVAERSAE